MRIISISNIKPTQIAIGYEQMSMKYEKLNNMKNKEFKKYFDGHKIPVIEYNNFFYAIDHHHLLYAYHLMSIPNIQCNVIDDFSEYDNDTFWMKMCEKKYFWLYNECGKELNLKEFIENLPGDITKMRNDPYRSLAGIVRKKNGYEKNWTPFSEFVWANFFRKTDIVLNYNLDTKISSDIIQKAIKLAGSEIAKDLPGFIM